MRNTLSITSRQWTTFLILVVLSVLVVVFTYTIFDQLHSQDTDCQLLVSRLIREYHAYYQQGEGYETLYKKFLEKHPSFFQEANTNGGAELLYEFHSALGFVSDTDEDGKFELCDDDGNPLIFLTNELQEDLLVTANGDRVRVYRPPYVKEKGFYISILDHHDWMDEESFQKIVESQRDDNVQHTQSKGLP